MTVDDSVSVRMMVGFSLKEAGFDIVEAVNGVDALSKLDKHDIRMVVADVNMPEMDGHEALESIRKIENKLGIAGLDGVKVIMTTALSDSASVIGAFREGCEAYIVKPLGKRNLFEEMEKLGLVNLSGSSSVK